MISQDTIQKLTAQFQTNELNIIREYFQHLFLSRLYETEGAEKVLFKGGTALRIVYGSPRFSEDLDFSVFGVPQRELQAFIENIFTKILVEIQRIGIHVELGPKPGPTSGGYYGEASFRIYEYPPTTVSINVSARNGREMRGEVDSVSNDFVPTYNVFHLSQESLVDEKVDALLERRKARDFYDLYFIMRKGLLTPRQKTRLNQERNSILQMASAVDFRDELSVFLPQKQQDIIRDFRSNLAGELNRQLSGI
jgi:predicted nucleotidyltransferase component of viral defense system